MLKVIETSSPHSSRVRARSGRDVVREREPRDLVTLARATTVIDARSDRGGAPCPTPLSRSARPRLPQAIHNAAGRSPGCSSATAARATETPAPNSWRGSCRWPSGSRGDTRTATTYDDLVQVASFALMKAIDRYDPDRGVAFSTYAVPTIVGELKRYFRDHTWTVRVPRELHDRALQVQRASEQLTASLGRSPTPAEVAEAMECSVELVLEALQTASALHPDRLDGPSDDDEDDRGGPTAASEETGYAVAEASATLAPLLARLTPSRAKGPEAALRARPHAVGDRSTARGLADARVADPAQDDRLSAGSRCRESDDPPCDRVRAALGRVPPRAGRPCLQHGLTTVSAFWPRETFPQRRARPLAPAPGNYWPQPGEEP